mgnify:CR=1 FL=1
MRPYVVLRYVGLILLLNAAFMFLSFFISLYNNDGGEIPLLLSGVLTSLFGLFPTIFVPKNIEIKTREAYSIVVFSWLVSCVFGMLPFLLYGGEFTIANAWFEVVSGYTTTGSTVLKDIEAVPKGILFWRASTHWIGGVGIVLFALVILPSLGKAKMIISRFEISSLAKENFHYKTRKTLHVILVVYLGLTILQTVLLKVYGMSLFDAVTHTFATVATGGFSPKNLSIAYYDSFAIELIIMIFMFLSGIHFGLLFVTFALRKANLFKSQIVRYYFFSMLAGVVLVAINLKGNVYDSWTDAFRYSAFQVLSVGTTTGFANADSSVWPPLSIMLITFFTLQCACAGSTSGGLKVDRIVIFFQSLRRQFLKLQHPQAVIPVRINGQPIEEESVDSALLFITFYIVIVFITAVLLSAMGIDTLTSFSASAATMGNVGPGFGAVGSMSNFASIPDLGKFLLSINMLLGRLEIFGLLLILRLRS